MEGSAFRPSPVTPLVIAMRRGPGDEATRPAATTIVGRIAAAINNKKRYEYLTILHHIRRVMNVYLIMNIIIARETQFG